MPTNPLPHIRWSVEETYQVAERHASLFGSKKATRKSLLRAQTILPTDRHKTQFTPMILSNIREKIVDLASSTQTNGEVRLVESPESLISITPLYTPICVPSSAMLDLLIEINRAILKLKSFPISDFEALRRSPLELKRLHSLTIQACNGLTFFEELTD